MNGMPDREKISGFELCANGKPCIGEKFTQCPFSPRNNDEQNCGVTMARFALALLKEQEAIEPKEKDYVWRCGKCDEYLTSIENHRIRFCLYCGKAVKWE